MTPAWVCFRHRPEDIAARRLRRPDRRRQAGVRDATRSRKGNFEVIVSGCAEGRRQLARDRRPGGEVVRHPDRHRRLLRADPRRQQHQPGRVDGRLRDPAPAGGGGGGPARGVLRRGRPDHPPGRSARAACSRSPRRWPPASEDPGARDPAAADEHDREDPLPPHARRAAAGEAGRRGAGLGRRRLLARLHLGPGALFPGAGVRRRLPDPRSRAAGRPSRTTWSMPTRCRTCAASCPRSRRCGPCSASSSTTRGWATSCSRTASRPASATRWPAR